MEQHADHLAILIQFCVKQHSIDLRSLISLCFHSVKIPAAVQVADMSVNVFYGHQLVVAFRDMSNKDVGKVRRV